MEESGSEGLDEVVHREAKTFLKDVDAVCISCVFSWSFSLFGLRLLEMAYRDNYWLGTKVSYSAVSAGYVADVSLDRNLA